jgi:hypothetical protein
VRVKHKTQKTAIFFLTGNHYNIYPRSLFPTTTISKELASHLNDNGSVSRSELELCVWAHSFYYSKLLAW